MRGFIRLVFLSALFFAGMFASYTKADPTPNDAESVQQIRIKADQGDAKAQFSLGMMYYSGEGVPQDYKQAVKWYRKAADQGAAMAQFSLGWMYKEGKGVPQDYAQAYMWAYLAAAQGNEEDVKMRDDLVKKLTPSQIEEGQRLTREWIATHPQGQVAQ
jgi:uncharacterized protein